MNLLVVSHPCVTPVNQQLYAEVEQRTGWNLTIVAPAQWKTAYNEIAELERWPSFQGELVPYPVWFSGSIPLHVYRTFFHSILKRVAPNAIYVHNEPYAVSTAQVYLANLFFDRCPIGFYSAQNIVKSYPPPFRWMEQWVFNQSDFAFPVTKDVRDVLNHKGFDNTATVLPLGIDAELYSPSPDDALRQQWASQEGTVVIGYLGRLVEEKGLSTLIDALAHIEAESWHLVLVGSGPFESQLRTKLTKTGLSNRVTFTGYVPHDEAPRYLASFDILVLPSETQPNWKEQFGRVIVEALACETPVLGSDSGAIPQVIQSTSGGLFFPERNTEACAHQLTRLIQQSDLRKTLASEGRQSVLKNYTHKALSKTFAETIEQNTITK